MINENPRLRLFALVIPIALLVSLSCKWAAPVSSGTKFGAQSNAWVAADIQSTIHDRTRLPSTLYTEADFTSHVNELNTRLKKKLSSGGPHAFSIFIQKPF